LTDIELTPEVKQAVDFIHKERNSAFITGRAGTGKSTLLRHVREISNRPTIALAPTGVAAINITGQTIHSFFHFKPKLITPSDITNSNGEILSRIETVIIDEVSMIRVDLMDGIDKALRKNRKSDEPFGGVQILLFGDLHQLPPVVREKELRDYFNTTYGGIYFFHAPVFREHTLPLIELQTTHRHNNDPQFIEILNQVRINTINSALSSELNKRVFPMPSPYDRKEYVTLTTTNKAAFEINSEMLKSLRGKEGRYEAIISGEFAERDFPTERILLLKKGARVILLRNDIEKRWVNGTVATIAKLRGDRVWVNIDGNRYELLHGLWENIRYEYNSRKNTVDQKIIGTFRQYPIRLAWALTIHKSQGQTIDKAYIDFATGTFAHGQAYVALSRTRTLDGLALSRPFRRSDIVFDEGVLQYRRIFKPINKEGL